MKQNETCISHFCDLDFYCTVIEEYFKGSKDKDVLLEFWSFFVFFGGGLLKSN